MAPGPKSKKGNRAGPATLPAETKLPPASPSLNLEDITEVIDRAVTGIRQDELTDKTAWNYARYTFEDWTAQQFNSVKRGSITLRDTLRRHGVFVDTEGDDVGDSLVAMLKEAEQHEWTLDEVERAEEEVGPMRTWKRYIQAMAPHLIHPSYLRPQFATPSSPCASSLSPAPSASAPSASPQGTEQLTKAIDSAITTINKGLLDNQAWIFATSTFKDWTAQQFNSVQGESNILRDTLRRHGVFVDTEGDDVGESLVAMLKETLQHRWAMKEVERAEEDVGPIKTWRKYIQTMAPHLIDPSCRRHPSARSSASRAPYHSPWPHFNNRMGYHKFKEIVPMGGLTQWKGLESQDARNDARTTEVHSPEGTTLDKGEGNMPMDGTGQRKGMENQDARNSAGDARMTEVGDGRNLGSDARMMEEAPPGNGESGRDASAHAVISRYYGDTWQHPAASGLDGRNDARYFAGDARTFVGASRMAEVGDARNSVGDVRSFVGDARSFVGDARNPVGDARYPMGDVRNPVGDFRNFGGDARNPVSDARDQVSDARNSISDTRMAGVGDARNSVGDARNPVGDARYPVGDVRNPVGDFRNFGGDARNSMGDARNPVGDARNLVGDARYPVGDARNSIIDTHMTEVGDARMAGLGDARSPMGDARYPVGDARNPVGDARNPMGDARYPVGDARYPVGDARNPMGDARYPVGDARNLVGNAGMTEAGDTRNSVGDTRMLEEVPPGNGENNRDASAHGVMPQYGEAWQQRAVSGPDGRNMDDAGRWDGIPPLHTGHFQGAKNHAEVWEYVNGYHDQQPTDLAERPFIIRRGHERSPLGRMLRDKPIPEGFNPSKFDASQRKLLAKLEETYPIEYCYQGPTDDSSFMMRLQQFLRIFQRHGLYEEYLQEALPIMMAPGELRTRCDELIMDAMPRDWETVIMTMLNEYEDRYLRLRREHRWLTYTFDDYIREHGAGKFIADQAYDYYVVLRTRQRALDTNRDERALFNRLTTGYLYHVATTKAVSRNMNKVDSALELAVAVRDELTGLALARSLRRAGPSAHMVSSQSLFVDDVDFIFEHLLLDRTSKYPQPGSRCFICGKVGHFMGTHSQAEREEHMAQLFDNKANRGQGGLGAHFVTLYDTDSDDDSDNGAPMTIMD